MPLARSHFGQQIMGTAPVSRSDRCLAAYQERRGQQDRGVNGNGYRTLSQMRIENRACASRRPQLAFQLPRTL